MRQEREFNDTLDVLIKCGKSLPYFGAAAISMQAGLMVMDVSAATRIPLLTNEAVLLEIESFLLIYSGIRLLNRK